jgi:hypothetical protein
MKMLLYGAALLSLVVVVVLGVRERRLHAELEDELTSETIRGAADSGASNLELARSWKTYSPDGHSVLSQVCTGERSCTLRCTVGEARDAAWTVRPVFVADANDERFVSDDCAHVWVVYPVASTQGLALAPAAVFLTAGKLTCAIPLSGFVRKFDKVRTLSAHVEWLRGELGSEGRPPHYAADGDAVELDTLDGLHHRLAFDLQEPPGELAIAEDYAKQAGVQQASAPTASSDRYRWTDDSGAMHETQNPAEVPVRYRARVRQVSAGAAPADASRAWGHGEPFSEYTVRLSAEDSQGRCAYAR